MLSANLISAFLFFQIGFLNGDSNAVQDKNKRFLWDTFFGKPTTTTTTTHAPFTSLSSAEFVASVLCTRCRSCKCDSFHIPLFEFDCTIYRSDNYRTCDFECKEHIDCSKDPAQSRTTANVNTHTGIYTTAPPILLTCDKIAVITAVAKNVQIEDSRAATCPDGQKTSTNAFPLKICNLADPLFWKPGQKVIDGCRSQTLGSYAPIAMFPKKGMLGQQTDLLAGVLVGCSSDGFSIAAQKCNETVEILHITSASEYNIQDFYRIQL